MKLSLFIRSYRNDFEWLSFALRSIEKHGSRLHEVIVTVPESDIVQLKKLPLYGAQPIGVVEHTVNGYISQQVTKCHADLYCSGDFVLHMDSDAMAIAPIIPEDFLADGQPKLLIRDWDHVGDAKCWHHPTRTTLMAEPPYETMAALPIIYHRDTHRMFREYVAEIQGRDFITYVSRLSRFSEFNAIGNFCLLHTPEAYRFIRATGPDDGYPRPIRQFWSHARITRAEMEALLK